MPEAIEAIDLLTWPGQRAVFKPSWSMLTKKERAAARRIGFSDELWHRGTPPEAFSRSWLELTLAEMKAATTLGYGEVGRLWDATRGQRGKDKLWMYLRLGERRAARELGYAPDTWDAGEDPPACTVPWPMLRDDERAAALLLGYTQLSWDAELEAVEEDLPLTELIERIVRVEVQSRGLAHVHPRP